MTQPSSGAGTGDPADMTGSGPVRLGTWRTPRGNLAHLLHREGTSDWNTLTSCMTEDEYALRGLWVAGWALDIGAHIGGVAIALALDNPDLRVMAIEPVPPNVQLLRTNVALNQLTERVIVIDGAAAGPDDVALDIGWGYRGTEVAEHHAYIGNATLTVGADHETTSCVAYSLPALIDMCGRPISFAKIDCEGCEARFLASPAVRDVTWWCGEWHPPHIDEAGIHALLDATHEVTTWGPGPGGFRAIRR